MAHSIDYIARGPFDHTARCSCGWTVDPRLSPLRTKQQAEDEVLKHERQVERARHHLTRGNPTLASQYDYYKSMADNVNLPDAQREQWLMLATGLAHRLGYASPRSEQAELFPSETKR